MKVDAWKNPLLRVFPCPSELKYYINLLLEDYSLFNHYRGITSIAVLGDQFFWPSSSGADVIMGDGDQLAKVCLRALFAVQEGRNIVVVMLERQGYLVVITE